MAPIVDPTALSNSELQQLYKRVQCAQEQLYSAQGQIIHAQGCLNEVSKVLSTRPIQAAASTSTSLNNPIETNETPQDVPAVASQTGDTKSESGDIESSNATDEAENTDGAHKYLRRPRFSTTPLTDEQKASLRFVVGIVKRTSNAVFFLQPVDHVALNLPTYPEVIKHPMDIGTMRTKLWANEYESVQAFVDDLQLIVDNARTFNGTKHAITHAAYGMQIYVYEKMESRQLSECLPQKFADRKRKEASE